MTNATIQITRRLSTEDGNRRLRAWISGTTHDIPPTIFVYQRLPTIPLDDGLSDLFVHIASYPDILDFPTNEPNFDTPFFRQHWIDVAYTGSAELNRTWELIEQQISSLLQDLIVVNSLPPADIEVVTIP